MIFQITGTVPLIIARCMVYFVIREIWEVFK